MSVILPSRAIAFCVRNRIINTFCGQFTARNLSGIPELTRVRYPDVKRGSYAQLNEDDVSAFTELLDSNRVLTEYSDLEGKFMYFCMF